MYKPHEIANVIKDLATENNATVKQVLEDCAINKGFIYDLEHKQTYPSADKIAKLAEYFNVSANIILGIDP